jgi:membrane protein
MKNLISRLRVFFTEGLWQQETAGWRGFLLNTLRVLILSLRGLVANRSLIRASALAYLTGLAFIPLLALLFAILKSLGIQRLLDPHLMGHLAPGSQDFAQQILSYIDATQVASLGVFGVVFLLGDLLVLMTNVERAFNDTWGVGRTRPWRRKLSDYLSIFLILPILMAVAVSVATSFLAHPEIWRLLSGVLPREVLAATSGLFSLGLFWVAFTFIYLVMPNTRVSFISAAIGGLAGTTLWQGAQILVTWLYSQASYYNAIYGVVYQLLFFTLWMYWSWLIVLYGMEVTYAHQNLASLCARCRRPAPPREPVDEYLALGALVAVSRRFLDREPPLTLEELSVIFGGDDLLALRVMETLKSCRLVLEIANSSRGRTLGYVPAVDLSGITVGEIVALLARDRGGLLAELAPGDPRLAALLQNLTARLNPTPWDRLTLKELAQKSEEA